MHEKFEVALSKEEYVVGLSVLFGELAKLDLTRNRMIFQRLGVVVVLMLAVSWFFPESMIGIFVIIVGFAVMEAVMANIWVRSGHGASYDPAVGQQRIEFTDGTISDTSTRRSRQWKWAAVRRVHDRPEAVVFELVGWDMIVLPSRLWSSPADRHRFLDEARDRITNPVDDEPVSKTLAPMPQRADLFTLAAIGAFVDVCLVVTAFLPTSGHGYDPLVEMLGRTGAIALIVLLSGLLGYLAYRLAKAGLPRLNERSPATATGIAQALIWGFAAWFGATSLGWI